MKRIGLSLAPVCAALTMTSAHAEDLTVERLHAEPALSGAAVTGAQISPDGALATVLQGRKDDARQLDLWAYDLETGEGRRLVSSTDLIGGPETLSEEEKNRRERMRQYGRGIVSYNWDAEGKRILFPLGGDVFAYDLTAEKATQITDTEGFETDAKVSAQGGYVAYVRNDEVFVYNLNTGRERQITKGAGGTVRNGVAEFVVQEEFSRYTGYWMSPDETRLAYTQIDEAPVKIIERLDFGADGAKSIRQRYPFAGTDNVRIKLGIAGLSGGGAVWADLGDDPDIYLVRANWSRNSKTLYVQRLSRDQKTLDLLAVNPKTGASKVILTETSATWLNINDMFTPLSDGGFLWGSERDGFAHLYRYAADGTLKAQLTEGAWPVTDLNCVSEADDAVYFTGWRVSALERHIYRIGLNGGAPEQLTAQAGWHSAVFSGNCTAFIQTYSNPNQPPQVSVHDADGARKLWLGENKLDETHPYAPYLASHQPSEYGTLDADDGTPMNYRLIRPSQKTGLLRRRKKHPAIVYVYGGPGVQTVRKAWRNEPFVQLLVDEGFVVFQLDNRGGAGRGKAFEDPLYRAMGGVEVRDQAVGAAFLARHPDVDPDRIGAYGWSYGGYMTLMMLSQTPEFYAAGVSGAPVSAWELYDTGYTERYMGDPRKDMAAYEASAVFAHLDGLKGDLLLLHGMADDNVVFEHAIRVMDALQKAGKPFELMTYPCEKHGFRARHNRLDRDRRLLEFFNRTLK
ncbi:MAG: S9 family peptidase [Pseudomonadota bacterium]